MLHSIVSYTYIIIYIILWILICYNYYKKVGVTSGFIVIASYLIYGILSLFLYANNYYGTQYRELTLFPFIYLLFMVLIFLKPVFKYETKSIYRVRTPSIQIINVFFIVYCVSSIVILPNVISKLNEGLTLLFLEESGGLSLYQDAHNNYVTHEVGFSGFYGMFAAINNIFRNIAMFLFAYYLTLNKKNKIIVVLLCVNIVVDLLYPISNGARTDVIMNVYALLMAISLFFPFYSDFIQKCVKKASVILIVIVAIPFVVLTISRFSNSDEGAQGSTLFYIGQAPLNFNAYALNNGGIRYGDRTINQFKQFFLEDIPRDVQEVRHKYSHHKMNDSIFSTFVGDFVLDFGPLGAFLIFVLLSVFFFMNIHIHKRTVSFRALFMVYFILCIAMQGGMYLFNYSFVGNLTIIAYILMYLVFFIDSRIPGPIRYIEKRRASHYY